MTQRLNYTTIAPAGTKALRGVHGYIAESGLPSSLLIERRDAFVDGDNDAACFGPAHSTIPAGSFQGICVIAANTSKGQTQVTEQSGPDLAKALQR